MYKDDTTYLLGSGITLASEAVGCDTPQTGTDAAEERLLVTVNTNEWSKTD